MEPMTAAIIGSALIGGVTGVMQSQSNARAQRAMIKAQDKRDRINMVASAYGLGSGMSPAQMPVANNQWMQGALAGAQFAVMNPSLWDKKNKSNSSKSMSAEEKAFANYLTTKDQYGYQVPVVQQPPYANQYMVAPQQPPYANVWEG